MLEFVLSFIAGKDAGREFPLPADLELVIGRESDADLLSRERTRDGVCISRIDFVVGLRLTRFLILGPQPILSHGVGCEFVID